ncbi:hypothetical protein KM043_007906 [Ampulex compressa]|nr:hypothetical protein KM043_007906 [Ampulex compressa]
MYDVVGFGRINMSCYVNSYVIQFFMTVLSIAGLLANINHSLIMGNKALVCAFTMDVISHYFVVFINITPCQRVKDQSTDLFHNMCGGCWYEAPLPSQKLLLFMMRKLQQPFIPSAAGIFDMTYETFSKIVQVSFSYFIIMTSMQEDVL